MRLFVIFFILVSSCFASGYEGRYPSEWLGDNFQNINLQVKSLGVGCTPSGVSGEVKASSIEDCDGDWSIDSAGRGTFDGGVEYAPMAAAPSAPSTGVILYSDSEDNSAASFLFNGNADPRFTIKPDGDDVVSTWNGTSNSGTITWDDSSSAFDLADPLESSNYIRGSSLLSLTFVRAATGYYGDTTSDPSLHPEGAQLAPMAAAPSAPTTGAIIFFDENDGNLKCIFADSDIVTIATNP